MVASLQDAPQASLPPGIQALVWSPPTWGRVDLNNQTDGAETMVCDVQS